MAQATLSFMASSGQAKPLQCTAGMNIPSTVVRSSALVPCRSCLKPVKVSTHQSTTLPLWHPLKQDSKAKFVMPVYEHEPEPEETFHVKKSQPVLVRPAKPTYNGTYYLSGRDHTVMYPIEVLYSYKGNGVESSHNFGELLKRSLAEVLVHFYPLAGKLAKMENGNYMVNCTGKGVYFVEAVVEQDLEEFGDFFIPNSPKLPPLLHFHKAKDIVDVPLLTVQVTRFKCGGFILGFAYNHCMMDGVSFDHFMNSWAEIAKGLPLSVPPFLDRSIMKPRQLSKSEISAHCLSKFEGLFTKRDTSYRVTIPKDEQKVCTFIDFGPQKLTELKKIVMEEGMERMPTKFELLTAFFWRAIVRSTKVEEGKRAKLLLPVNLRQRLGAPFPKGYFGNGIGLAYTGRTTEEELAESSLSAVVKQVQETLQSATSEHLEAFLGCIEATGLQASYENALLVSDLSRMSFYKTDFGWGYPKEFRRATMRKNVLMFLPQKERDLTSVTALIALPPAAMKIFKEYMG